MNMQGNTILITGGGSGIGKGLAEAFHKLGNQVIIAGRNQKNLDAVTSANAGMQSATLNIEDPIAIKAFARQISNDFPKLNVLINNAGVMIPENLLEDSDLTNATSMVTTNLLGPIRLTTALLPVLKKQQTAVIMNNSSGLAFVPLTVTPTYSATKAALHSYTESLRYQLKGSSIQVLELIPPYVQTTLTGHHQETDARAMPLQDFLTEVMSILEDQPDIHEVCVNNVNFLRHAAEGGQDKYNQVFVSLNDAMSHASTAS